MTKEIINQILVMLLTIITMMVLFVLLYRFDPWTLYEILGSTSFLETAELTIGILFLVFILIEAYNKREKWKS